MKDQIFVLDDKQNLIELSEQEFEAEKHFQELLEKHPQLISGNQINPDNPRKWLLISREVGVPNQEDGSNVFSLDHLFVDQDSIPTLVEVKRSSDTRIRREVVGQMLDYAANAVAYWSLEVMISKYEVYCNQNDINPDLKIQEFIGENKSVNEFWENVGTNIKAGKIRMLFVADKIPKELQRVIEFLNEQMDPAEVLGVEIKYYANKSIKTLVPRVIGQTSIAQIKKGVRETNQWTKETFFAELNEKNGVEVTDITKKILSYFEGKVSRLWYGQGKRSGSIVPVKDLSGTSHVLFVLWTYGKIETYFQWYKEKPPFNDINKRKELLSRINDIKGVNISIDKIDKRPSFDTVLLKEKSEFDKFIATFDWFLGEI